MSDERLAVSRQLKSNQSYLLPTNSLMDSANNLLLRLKELNEIGIALSQQRDINSLLETILVAAKRITNADAGTLYLHEPERRGVGFGIMRTDSLNIAVDWKGGG